jgi:hypothetical protein
MRLTSTTAGCPYGRLDFNCSQTHRCAEPLCAIRQERLSVCLEELGSLAVAYGQSREVCSGTDDCSQ